MALSKSISVAGSGISATYWVLSALNVDFNANHASVVLSGYVSAQHKIDGFKPILHKTLSWTGSENPITVARMQAGTAFSAAIAQAILPQSNPFLPPNPFEGATIVA